MNQMNIQLHPAIKDHEKNSFLSNFIQFYHKPILQQNM